MEVSINQAQKQLAELIKRAQDGEDVLIRDTNLGTVRLLPIKPAHGQGLTLEELRGCMRGKIHYEEGWDAPLSDEELEDFYRRD